jgi:hypothetical protein
MSANVSSVECIESGEKGWPMYGECSESGLSRVANLLNTRQIRRSESQKFAQYSPNLPKRVTKICSILAKFAGASHKNLANFWRVLEFDKFAGEWPLLNFFLKMLGFSKNVQVEPI